VVNDIRFGLNTATVLESNQQLRLSRVIGAVIPSSRCFGPVNSRHLRVFGVSRAHDFLLQVNLTCINGRDVLSVIVIIAI
jgi:hypothetical protein